MTNGNNLYNLIPPIKRCREYHLYDYKGNRYLDMYLDQGRALMGHKPGKTMLTMKNSLEKGLWAAYPSIYDHRLKKLLAGIFPSYRYFSFHHKERLETALKNLTVAPESWQPLAEKQDESGEILLITPLIPGIETVIAASQTEAIPGEILPPFILEGLIRNFHDYLSFKQTFDRKIWENFDNYIDWERMGPALYFRGNPDEYGALFKRALENKVLLPFTREIPAIIPSQLSSYEIKCIHRTFIPGETAP